MSSRSRGFYDIGILALDGALMSGGERASLARVIVDAAGNCEKPVGFEYVYTRPLGKRRGESQVSCHSTILTGDARCRRCAACRELRRNLWTFRALQELRAAPGRSWFGTLTLCPAERTVILAEARQYCARSGVDFDDQDEVTKFRDLCRQLGERLTRYLKRLRRTGAVFRYIFVAESHKTGDPHLHCLLHEHGSVPVRKEALEAEWSQHGFSVWRLIPFDDTGAAYYVCKYLSKEAEARVRASTRYGSAEPAILIHRRTLVSRDDNDPHPPKVRPHELGHEQADLEVRATALSVAR